MSRVRELLAGFKSAVVVELTPELARERGLRHRVSKSGQIIIEKDAGSRALLLEGRENEGPGVPSLEELRALAAARGIEWNDGWGDPKTGRVIPYWYSDESVDAHGDIVLQNWRFETFAKNPAMPFSHNWGGNPIGGHMDWKVLDRKDGPALWLLSLFATAEVSMEGDSVLRQVRAGFLRGSSVGFISHKVIDVKDEEERAQLGLGRWGFVLDENELLEGSPTLLPANTNAGAILALGKKQGLIQPLDLEVIRELSRLAFVNERAEVPQGKTAQQAWKEQDDTWLAIARLLFPSDHWLRARTLSEPILRHEDEEPKPPAEEPKASSLEEKVDRVLALVETIGVSLSQRLEDIRGLLEDREAETPANENGRAAAHAERTPAPNPLQEVDERMERMLRTIDQGRAAAAAK